MVKKKDALCTNRYPELLYFLSPDLSKPPPSDRHASGCKESIARRVDARCHQSCPRAKAPGTEWIGGTNPISVKTQLISTCDVVYLLLVQKSIPLTNSLNVAKEEYGRIVNFKADIGGRVGANVMSFPSLTYTSTRERV